MKGERGLAKEGGEELGWTAAGPWLLLQVSSKYTMWVHRNF